VKKTLVIGFGNIYRRDDGVGFVVVNALREKLGRPPLDAEDDGYDDLGHEIDTLLLHQLVPDLAEVVAAGIIPDLIHEEEVIASYQSAIVPHQLHPGTVLTLAHELYDSQPRGVLLSIRGYDFDFGEELSAQTAELVPAAVARVLALAADGK